MRSYSSDDICERTGLTYRQLDHWARHELFIPSIVHAHGSGSQRRWSRGDLRTLQVAKRALDAGATTRSLDGLQVAMVGQPLDRELFLVHVHHTELGTRSWSAHLDADKLVEVVRQAGSALVIHVPPVQKGEAV